MKNVNKTALKSITLGLFSLFLSACDSDSTISFSQDVKPILDNNCIRCHQTGGLGEVASGFNMSTYDGLIKGAKFGPMIIAGDVEGSNMLVLMEGRADPSISMPHDQKKPILAEDIKTIRLWIEQGAKNN